MKKFSDYYNEAAGWVKTDEDSEVYSESFEFMNSITNALLAGVIPGIVTSAVLAYAGLGFHEKGRKQVLKEKLYDAWDDFKETFGIVKNRDLMNLTLDELIEKEKDKQKKSALKSLKTRLKTGNLTLSKVDRAINSLKNKKS